MDAAAFVDYGTSFAASLSRRVSGTRPGCCGFVERIGPGYTRRFTRRNDGLFECGTAPSRFCRTEAASRQACDSLRVRERSWSICERVRQFSWHRATAIGKLTVSRMSTCLKISILSISCGLLFALCGCVAPRPQVFADTETLPSHYIGRGYRAFASGQLLTIEVTQAPGLNVAGFDTFAHDGALYVSPRRISSGGGGTRTFEVDVSGFHLKADWPTRTYWLVESYAYPICHPGFWSSAKRSPAVRSEMKIARR